VAAGPPTPHHADRERLHGPVAVDNAPTSE
jgi:hypothetical protein